MDRQNNEQNNQPDTNQQSSAENNPQQNDSPQAQQQFHFFIYTMPGTPGADNNTTPPIFFFTPFFMPQQVRKPHASESAMKRLPIVTITKEHVDSHASCPICLEPFSLSTEQEEKVDDKTETNQHEPVRQMPCSHVFCESCLFQWLRQNNSCPLCRKEIEAEGTEEVNNAASAPPNIPNVLNIPLFGTINIVNPTTTNPNPSPSPSPSTNSNANVNPNPNPNPNANVNPNPNPNPNANSNSNSLTRRPTISCALANVGCCEEIDNDERTSIITLPQCHHRFHASCLRTSLLVEGYPPDDFNLISRPLNFHCPTCRAPAIVQSDVLKMPAVPHEGQQELPITIHIPDMDLD